MIKSTAPKLMEGLCNTCKEYCKELGYCILFETTESELKAELDRRFPKYQLTGEELQESFKNYWHIEYQLKFN